MPGSAGNGEIIVERDDLGNELPSPLAETVVVTEYTGIHVKGSAAGLFKGELEVSTRGAGRSPAAAAVAFLIVAATAGLSAAAVSAICWLAHAPSPLTAAAGLTGFLGVQVTGLVLAFRRDRPPVVYPTVVIPDPQAVVTPPPIARHLTTAAGTAPLSQDLDPA
ncbi:MAG TPA: hypothetical protein VF060_28675 [Trebonia sp.]